jgi:hypothetical protein
VPAPAYPHLRTREIQISKFSPGSHQINTRTHYPYPPTHEPAGKKTAKINICKIKTAKEKKNSRTRTRGTRDGHGYETGRVPFWKKKPSTRARRTRARRTRRPPRVYPARTRRQTTGLVRSQGVQPSQGYILRTGKESLKDLRSIIYTIRTLLEMELNWKLF